MGGRWGRGPGPLPGSGRGGELLEGCWLFPPDGTLAVDDLYEQISVGNTFLELTELTEFTSLFLHNLVFAIQALIAE